MHSAYRIFVLSFFISTALHSAQAEKKTLKREQAEEKNLQLIKQYSYTTHARGGGGDW